jgi:hypothetical protein
MTMTTALATLTFDEMTRLAESVAKSGLFGMKTGDQALALMAISAAEGVHPALAARDYHIIQGRPTLKADAMLSRFQSAGGKMTMMEYTDTRVVAEFSHPQGGKVTIDWDIERAKRAGLTGKDVWKQYARQMLRARVISEGVRTVFPGATAGMMAPEEAMDVAPLAEVDITPAKPLTGVAALKAAASKAAEYASPSIAEQLATTTDLITGEIVAAIDPEVFSHDEIMSMADRATDKDDWSACLDMARAWSDEDKKPLRAKYEAWKAAKKAA